jgi:hypothetical protein
VSGDVKVVNIFRAQGVLDEDEVRRVTIHIHEPMPDVDHDAVRSRAFFISEAAALASAIWSSCPGGTVDALIHALLVRRASLLRVTFPGGEEANR